MRFPRLTAVLLGAAALTGAARAADTGFPPISTTGASLPGKPVFTQLVTPSLADAERFYGGMFGWTFRDVPTSHWHYAEAMSDGRNIASLIERPLPDRPGVHASWLVFFSVADVDRAVAEARERGARVLAPARDVPGLGREAVLSDPEGGTFALLHAVSGDPADDAAAQGEWIWSSLHTPAPATAAGFYASLLGATPYSAAGDANHFVLASQNFARASINPLPPRAGSVPAHWLRFVRVADIAAATAKAQALGGRVAVAPYVDHDGGKVAIVIDPTGAALGLLEWPDDAPAETAK